MDAFEAHETPDDRAAPESAYEPADAVQGSNRRVARRHAVIASGLALVVAGAAVGFAIGTSGHREKSVTGGALLTARSSALAAPGAQITVTGSATVQGTPDTASFQVGVHSTAPTATRALAVNNARVHRLEVALQAHGVTAADMQTSQLDIYANTNRHGVVTSFSADDDLDVTMQNIADAGAALDAAASAVGNDVNLNGISFSISNTSALLATARAEAMQNARTEANQLAAGAGVSVGPIVRVTDQENTPSPYFFGSVLAAAPAGSVPLQPGSQPINVQVSVVYSLQG